MLELYFLFYRIPRMMTRLARERNRSPVKWTIIGIGAWIGAEVVVGVLFGVIEAIGVEFWGWPDRNGLNPLAYIVALVAALVSISIVTRILTNKPREQVLPLPPPPPSFNSPESTQN